jgi:secondary thiamine-phosphate synthase enzyme
VETITLHTGAHAQFVDVTDRVRALVRDSQIASGVVHLCVPHTTAAVTINENADPSVIHDILADLERLVPETQRYYGHEEGNSPGHTKSSLIGCSQTLLIEEGRLVLGAWQGIYFCEFDGPRTRQLHVKIVPD